MICTTLQTLSVSLWSKICRLAHEFLLIFSIYVFHCLYCAPPSRLSVSLLTISYELPLFYQLKGLRVPGMQNFPTLASQEQAFKEQTWSRAKALSMLSVYNTVLSGKDRQRVSKLEMFDEIEEWELIMQHYSMTLASIGNLLSDMQLSNLCLEDGEQTPTVSIFGGKG